jgi:hypothetical protein
MLDQLSSHPPQAVMTDLARPAADGRRASTVPSRGDPLPPPAALDAHARQTALVRASLLLSERRDRPTSRRWV